MQQHLKQLKLSGAELLTCAPRASELMAVCEPAEEATACQSVSHHFAEAAQGLPSPATGRRAGYTREATVLVKAQRACVGSQELCLRPSAPSASSRTHPTLASSAQAAKRRTAKPLRMLATRLLIYLGTHVKGILLVALLCAVLICAGWPSSRFCNTMWWPAVARSSCLKSERHLNLEPGFWWPAALGSLMPLYQLTEQLTSSIAQNFSGKLCR